MNWQSMYIGYSPGVTGSYTQSAGQVFVNNNLIVGNCVTNGPETVGTVVLSGGALYVTNSTHTAALVVCNGTFVLSNGATLVADNLIITNACARFENNGGTLTVSNMMLDPNLDSDGDGVSNGAEATAGTDPLNAASYFHMLGVTRSGNDMKVTWTTVGGHSYYLQSSTNSAALTGAGFTNVAQIGPVSGTGDEIYTYTHVNGGTNQTRYYRVKLGP